jgi:hypothetical protein
MTCHVSFEIRQVPIKFVNYGSNFVLDVYQILCLHVLILPSLDCTQSVSVAAWPQA